MKRILLWSALCSAAIPAAAQMSAGNISLGQTVIDNAGNNATQSSDGFYALNSAVGQSASIGVLANQGSFISGGFLGSSGLGLAPMMVAQSVSGIARPLLLQGLMTGVPSALPVTMAFSQPMIESNLTPAVSITAVRDNLGNTINESLPATVQYSPASYSAAIIPNGASWSSNHLYKIVVSSQAVDFQGQPLSSNFSFYFQTLADPTVDNAFLGFSDTGAKISVAAGTFSEPYFIKLIAPAAASADTSSGIIDPALSAAVNAANLKALGPVIATRDIGAYNAAGHALSASVSGAMTLQASYAETQTPGFVDGYGTKAKVKKLALYALDPVSALWVRLPSSKIDTTAQAVSAPVPFFSAYALIAAADVSAADAYAYPVPFRPHGPNAGLSAGQTGTDAAGITFVQLPASGRIDIYNVLGQRAWSCDIATSLNSFGEVVWDTRNNSGQLVASGVYIYEIKGPQDHKIGKLAIIR